MKLNTFFANSFLWAGFVTCEGPFKFCPDSACSDCPVSLAREGTGFPHCVVYETSDVFPGLGFPGSDSGGGYEAYLDIEEPDPGCATIVKSPAGVDMENCGFPIGTYKHATCSGPLRFSNTFMVQFCCGSGDCTAAGATSAKFRPGLSGSGGAVYLKDRDGDVIKPIEVGVPTTINAHEAKRKLERRDVDCDDWVKEGDIYTKLSDSTQVVTGPVESGNITITTSRTQSYTQSTGFNFGIVGNLVSFGASISESFTVEKTDGSEKEFTVPDGVSGVVGFTPILECSEGHTTCGDDYVSGEICWGAPDPSDSDKLRGIFAVIRKN